MPSFFDERELDREAARLAQYRTAYETATPEFAQGLGDYSRIHPTISPGVAYSLLQNGIGPGSNTANTVAHEETREKAHRGFGWHSIGDVVNGATGAVWHAVKAVTRPTFAAVSAPYEAFQGSLREMGDEMHEGGNPLSLLRFALPGAALSEGVEQTTAAAYAGAALRGRANAGTGFFASQDVAREQRERARASFMLDNHAMTPGRLLAYAMPDAVAAPGSNAYNVMSGLVDAAAMIFGDPSAKVLKVASEARKADKLLVGGPMRDVAVPFDEAGRVTGVTRNTVIPERAVTWLESKPGAAVMEFAAKTRDARLLDDATGNKLPVEALRDLTAATDSTQVREILIREITGQRLREKIGVSALGRSAAGMGALPFVPEFQRSMRNVRLLGEMPGKHADLGNARAALQAMDNTLLNARMPAELRDSMYAEMIQQTTVNGRYQVMVKALGHIEEKLVSEFVGQRAAARSGLYSIVDEAATVPRPTLTGRARDVSNLPGKAQARAMTTAFQNTIDSLRKFNTDDIGRDLNQREVIVNGEKVLTPSPHASAEYINTLMPLPDARDIRRATSRAGNIVNNQGWDAVVKAGDWLTGTVFKPLVLIRGAWTVRAIGEEQVRMGVAGLDSAFAHPLSYLAWMTGRKGLGGLDEADFKTANEMAAHMTKFGDAMSRGLGVLGRDKRIIFHRGYANYGKHEEGYRQAWASEVMKLRESPEATWIAGGLPEGARIPAGMDPASDDAIKWYFFDGPGRKIRLEMADSDAGAHLLTRTGSDAHIDSMRQRIQTKTRGHAGLMKGIATGAYDTTDATGKAVSIPIREGLDTNPRFVKALESITDTHGPTVATGKIAINAVEGNRSRYDQATEWGFNAFMSVPTNRLSRSPAFRQFYWKRVEEMAGSLDAASTEKAALAAERANLPKVAAAIRKEGGRGDLTLDNADLIAKQFGLDSTRELLYDLHERSQFFDATRLVFPFGEAWKEILTTWSKLGRENPTAAYRAGQLISEARKEGSSVIYDITGTPHPEGQGFFYSDPATGREMFAYPASNHFMRMFTGENIPLQSPVQGLNLIAGSVLPGFGPVVTYAASAVLPDTPDYNGIKKVLMPFGDPDTSGGFVESFSAAWMKKLQTGGWIPLPGLRPNPYQQRQFNGTVRDVMVYLASTGRYDLRTPEGNAALLADAKDKARHVYLARGLAQFVAPSAPEPRAMMKDKGGHLVAQFLVAEDYRKIMDEEHAKGGDSSTAMARFLDKWGDGAFLLAVSKTEGAAPPTDRALRFAQTHPNVVSQYENVYGYFVPGGEFSQDAMRYQAEAGQRMPISPEDALKMAQGRLGSMLYNRAKEKVGDNPTDADERWLREVQDAIKAEYPGYAKTPQGLTDPDAAVTEVIAASKSPALADTDAGKGLALYLKARDKAMAAARDTGLAGFQTANDAAHLRAWLRQVAAAIGQEHPDFTADGGLFQRVFAREMKDDEVEG